jgi:hypothetical protein
VFVPKGVSNFDSEHGQKRGGTFGVPPNPYVKLEERDMSIKKRGLVTALAVCGVAVAVPAVGIASGQVATAAKAKKVKIVTSKGKVTNGTQLTSGLITGTFGKGTGKGVLTIPDTKQSFKFKGGTLKITTHGTSGASNDAAGTWKAAGGSGKFKGAKGGGKFTGLQSKATFTYVGKITLKK